MAATRAAKQALRKEIKRRVALLSQEEKQRQSLIVCQKVRKWDPDAHVKTLFFNGAASKVHFGRKRNICSYL